MSELTIMSAAWPGKILLAGSADAFGLDLPRAPNTTAHIEGWGLCLWLRPDQWLLLCTAPRRASELAVRTGGHALDAGARFSSLSIRGTRAAQVLARGCPLDLRRLAPGSCARTRIEQVPALLLCHAPDEFEVMVERPLAHYFERWLQAAANG